MMKSCRTDDNCFLRIVLFCRHSILRRMKWIVIGANGMLGRDLVEEMKASHYEVVPLDLPEIDITQPPEELEQHLPEADGLVNCAAYTKVDDAETERNAAFAVNAEGVYHLALVALNREIPMVHVSTDYVFDGHGRRPYGEQDPVNPLNVYGASKLAGEKALRSTGCPYLIVRTQSLFGKHGPNFVKAIARKARESERPLKVVNDQFSAPTYTRHLANGIVRLMQAKAEGIVHVAAADSCSWFEFARQIVAEIQPGHVVIPIASEDMKRPAARPKNSLLNMERYQRLTGHMMPSWRSGLEAYFHEEDYFT